MRRTWGFTLIEILVVIAVVGILLTITMNFLSADRVSVNQTAKLFAAQVGRVRLEAIKNNTYAGLSVNTVSPGGYILWIDKNGDASYTAGTDLALETYAFGSGDLVRVRVSSASSTSNFPITFDARGIPNKAINGTLILCNRGNSFANTVNVSAQGRAQIVVGGTCS